MLPNLSRTVKRFSDPNPLKLITIEKTTIDFEPVINRIEVDFQAVIQPADYERLNPAEIDWSLKYIWIHSTIEFSVGQFVSYKGDYYKIIPAKYFSDYGYTEGHGEQVKNFHEVGL